MSKGTKVKRTGRKSKDVDNADNAEMTLHQKLDFVIAAGRATTESIRFPEYEKELMGIPYGIFFYAEKCIKGRWEEAEELIKKDAGWAQMYMHYIIKSRWQEAEDSIFLSERATKDYIESLTEMGLEQDVAEILLKIK